MDAEERLRATSGFQRDSGNAEKNWLAHEVTTTECEQVFFNQPLIVAPDAAHSDREARYFVLGQADTGRELFMVFTIRSESIRVISARDMSRQERKVYRGHG